MELASLNALNDALREAAQPFGVVHDVHHKDLLFDYIYRYCGENAIPAYFSGGLSDASQAKRAFDLSMPTISDRNPKILEFAAGYGRVARHAHTVFSGCQYTASDIHPEAVEFLKLNFDVESILSTHEPEDLGIGGDYDFIFVLSLFSHLPDISFARWLKTLYSMLSNRGVLLFTANGDFARIKHPVPFENMLNQELGWGYGPDSDQPDLDDKEYGTMIVKNSYVIQAIESCCPGAQLVRFESGVWFGQQDEWLIRKSLFAPSEPG